MIRVNTLRATLAPCPHLPTGKDSEILDLDGAAGWKGPDSLNDCLETEHPFLAQGCLGGTNTRVLPLCGVALSERPEREH